MYCGQRLEIAATHGSGVGEKKQVESRGFGSLRQSHVMLEVATRIDL